MWCTNQMTNFKKHHVLFAVVVIVSSLYFSKFINEPSINELKDNSVVEATRIIISPSQSYVDCNGQQFRSVGESTIGPCMSDVMCRENWPAGASYQFRDRSICCVPLGECGEFKTYQ